MLKYYRYSTIYLLSSFSISLVPLCSYPAHSYVYCTLRLCVSSANVNSCLFEGKRMKLRSISALTAPEVSRVCLPQPQVSLGTKQQNSKTAKQRRDPAYLTDCVTRRFIFAMRCIILPSPLHAWLSNMRSKQGQTIANESPLPKANPPPLSEVSHLCLALE